MPHFKRDESVLLIVDMQEKLLAVMGDRQTILENTVKLVRFSRIIDLPVVVTEQQNLGVTVPEIARELSDVQAISKLEFDCFRSIGFGERLAELNRKYLLITGIEAHICVAQTAISALSDYHVQVVSDAISSRSPHNKEIALRRMMQEGVRVTSTEMAIFELLEKAGTETFREVLKLVK